MSEPFIGEIVLFAGNFAPRGWALCNGQLLAVSQNTALFSILGTTYGGNGQTTFALPDLRGRVPMHHGTGPGLSQRDLGEAGGAETDTLNVNELPPHSHTVKANINPAVVASPVSAVPGGGNFYKGHTDGTTMDPAMIDPTGGGQPHNNVQPYLGLNFIICLEGIYPSRN